MQPRFPRCPYPRVVAGFEFSQIMFHFAAGFGLACPFSLLVGSTGQYHTQMGFFILICLVAVMILAASERSSSPLARTGFGCRSDRPVSEPGTLAGRQEECFERSKSDEKCTDLCTELPEIYLANYLT
jgi:hypothetical protein